LVLGHTHRSLASCRTLGRHVELHIRREAWMSISGLPAQLG
jgi:hypothetical protein